ncbi:MAG TPA: ATP-binding protein [Candidatus Binataceae bacterium]|nr:ATP-binding protein [Candidatus Binataceae bacterium]
MSDARKDDHQELLRQQTTLARFGELALRSDDLDEILTEACRLAGEALGTDLAKVVELQEDGQTLLVRAGVGWKPGVVGVATIKATDNTSEGLALKTGEPMISPDIATETRFKYPPFLTENGVRAVANVLIIGGKGKPPFGILQVDSRTPRQFTENDTAFLRSYANLLAATVDRLRVLAETRDEEARLRLALEADVAERTRQLTEANAKLQVEAAERERVEEALRQSHKMEAVGQLTGGLAHDFNNLLAAISGSLELIRTRTAEGRTAELGRFVEAAMVSTKRATTLTHRLLAFSRRQMLDSTPTDVNRLVGGMEDLFRRTVGPGIRIETKLAGDLWLTMCDQNQLESALLNLVLNARDAMPDGGNLLIETANTVCPDWGGEPRDVPADECVVVSVTDTGTGMAPDVLARAFDPFYTTKPMGQGTGLGLSMIHGYVEQSGGHVLLRSEIGQGTTVTIYLPRYLGMTVSDEEVRAAAPPPSAAASIAVLLVEDEPIVRMLTVEMLSDQGYTVLEAHSGRSGLSIVESGARIDLLITDVGLPGGMDGRQLANAVRQQRPDLKVLFTTGYAESAWLGNVRKEQGMEIMIKPFSMDAFLVKVQEMASS